MSIKYINETHYKRFAKKLNIELHQRYDKEQAAQLLKLNKTTLNTLIKNRVISFVQLSQEKTEFFGFQLVEYLLGSIVNRATDKIIPDDKNRILRFPEVRETTGLSRTTLWRMEKEDKFPHRVQLGKSSVGWKSREVQEWVRLRGRV